MNGQVVHIVDLERVAGKNADHGSNTPAVVEERIPAIGTEGRVQRKRNDAILGPDFGRGGDGNPAVSSDGSRHETKSAKTNRISIHCNYPLLLSSNVPDSGMRSFRVVYSEIVVFLTKPLGVSDGAVKLVSGFIKFELACLGSLCGFCEKKRNL
jgi:hypothetical protein